MNDELDRIAAALGSRQRAVVIAGDNAAAQAEIAERLKSLGCEVRAIGPLHTIAAYIVNVPRTIDLLVYEHVPGTAGMEDLFDWLKRRNPRLEFLAYVPSPKPAKEPG